jgi:hypothetical protein
MTLTSKPLAAIILVFLFGGIAFSALMGWWSTESSRQPARFTAGEYAGQADPNDIRGSYTFGDIAASFAVTPEVLAQAFGITGVEPASFAVKDLESLYADNTYEIGTASVRLFIAFYTGLPFDTTEQDIYLPQSATGILLAQGNLSPEQVSYLESHTVQVDMAVPGIGPEASPVQQESPVTSESAYTIKGKTTFGELVTWGVPQEVIEGILGAPIPNTAMTVKDYASANGLDFGTLKQALQFEVDKVIP